MFHKIQARDFIFPGVMGIIVIFAGRYTNIPPIVGVSLFVGVFLCLGSLFLLFDYIANDITDNFLKVNESIQRTGAVRMAEAAATMTPEQLEALGQNVALRILIPGEPQPIGLVRIGGEEIPLSFVLEFFSKGSERELCPIRHYRDGSTKQFHARLLTDYCVINNYAENSSGPYAARWKDKDRCFRSLGLNVNSLIPL